MTDSAAAIEPLERARAWAAAWNDRDVDAVLAHFSDNATFVSPIAASVMGNPEVRGKEALRAYWRAALARGGARQFEVERVLWDPQRRELVIIYVRTIDGRRSRACEILTIAEDGRAIRGEAMYGAVLDGEPPG